MEHVTKQHVEVVDALTSKHQLQVQKYSQQLEESRRCNEEDKVEIADLSMKLSEGDASYMELDAFVREEPERQQEAIRLAVVRSQSE